MIDAGLDGPDALTELGQYVGWPDERSGAETDRLLAHQPDLGDVARLARWLATVQATAPPRRLDRVRLVVAGTEVPSPLVLPAAIRAGVGTDAVSVPALPHVDAVHAGATYVDTAVESGLDALLLARPDPGLSVAAATFVSLLVDVEPVKVVSPERSSADWITAVCAVRDARRAAVPHRRQPHVLLAAAGSALDAWTAGFLLRAAQRRTPVVIDGLPAVAIALLADAAVPQAHLWWQIADTCPEPAHRLAADRLGMAPVLALGTACSDGTAALLALDVLRAAIDRLAVDP